MDETNTVVERMRTLVQAWEPAGDRRAIFLDCYARMTENMLVAVHDQRFEDNRWVSDLLQRFADYYFDALEAYEHGPNGGPSAWQVAFGAAQQPRIHALQHLILGVNAHINYDLVFTLADLLAPEWPALAPERRLARYQPRMDVVDVVLGRLDEWLTARLIGRWREQVWQNATALLQAADEVNRSALLQEVEARAVRRAHAVLGTGGIAGLRELVR